VPNWVEKVGLARTGGKQVTLKRADHRRIKRAKFISHNGFTSFPVSLMEQTDVSIQDCSMAIHGKVKIIFVRRI
jgi:hypothetical protein